MIEVAAEGGLRADAHGERFNQIHREAAVRVGGVGDALVAEVVNLAGKHQQRRQVHRVNGSVSLLAEQVHEGRERQAVVGEDVQPAGRDNCLILFFACDSCAQLPSGILDLCSHLR